MNELARSGSICLAREVKHNTANAACRRQVNFLRFACSCVWNLLTFAVAVRLSTCWHCLAIDLLGCSLCGAAFASSGFALVAARRRRVGANAREHPL